MNTIEKALLLIENYDSTGQDQQRIHVIEGVNFMLANKKKKAKESFTKSGLSKAGLIYFALRQYMGNEKQEQFVLNFILDEF